MTNKIQIKQPWTADHLLTESQVGEAIRGHLSDFTDSQIRFLSEGWESRVFEVDEKWIFRFPKRPEVFEDLERENWLLRLLSERLEVAIPRFEFFQKPSKEALHGFVGYSKIIGTSLHRVEDQDLEIHSLCKRLGDFLNLLHGTPKEQVTGPKPALLGGREIKSIRIRVAEAMEAMKQCAPISLLTQVAEAMSSLCEELEPYAGSGHLVHNDLYCQHILVDVDGRLSGVIDWGDVAWGDPAVDFAGLYAWFGEAFAEDLLNYYHHPRDKQFMNRVKFYALAFGVFSLYYGLCRPDQEVASHGIRELNVALTGKAPR